ncbi:MAG TPA: carbonic anhydrase, partial [Pyrinomonadaceae bacterium]|nr:carbonic anhydrase [Pyrinomonadaceae bacterium]
LSKGKLGLVDNWLRHVQDVAQKHGCLVSESDDEARCVRRLCELNVIEQVVNVCQTTIVEQAWEKGQELTVHGWIYGLEDGLVRDLNISVSSQSDVSGRYQAAVTAVQST